MHQRKRFIELNDLLLYPVSPFRSNALLSAVRRTVLMIDDTLRSGWKDMGIVVISLLFPCLPPLFSFPSSLPLRSFPSPPLPPNSTHRSHAHSQHIPIHSIPFIDVCNSSETIYACWSSFRETARFHRFNAGSCPFPGGLCSGCWGRWTCVDCAFEEASQRPGTRKRLPLHLVWFYTMHNDELGAVVSLASSDSVRRTMSRCLVL